MVWIEINRPSNTTSSVDMFNKSCIQFEVLSYDIVLSGFTVLVLFLDYLFLFISQQKKIPFMGKNKLNSMSYLFQRL